ncbi:hypothetical protein JL722_10960 [Aureococcus anophagefferens]|nr:hypothetical protein JL722_10960 [Aureococcus anophagefferens]
MRQRKDCDFSYAGLKNALRVQINERREALGLGEDAPLPAATRTSPRRSSAAIAHVEDRLKTAFKAVAGDLPDGGAPTLALVGGVAAARSRVGALCEARGWALAVPAPRLCTDNGAMVAWAAIES